jgi:hypothetical protein
MGKLKAASQARRSRPDEHVDVRQKVCSYERLPADILRKYNAAAAGRRERAFLSGSRIRRKRKALRLCHCWYCLALSSLFEISSLLFLSTSMRSSIIPLFLCVLEVRSTQFTVRSLSYSFTTLTEGNLKAIALYYMGLCQRTIFETISFPHRHSIFKYPPAVRSTEPTVRNALCTV